MDDSAGDERLFFAYTEGNREAILEVLRRVLPPRGLVLEIASGSGQHAAHFARAMPELEWQPTEREATRLRSIAAWRAYEGLSNMRPPLRLDVLETPWPIARADAVLNVNTVHIAPRAVGLALFEGAGRVLGPGGVLCIYGPYRVGGVHTAPSNAAFDRQLRAMDPRFGIWDVSEAAEAALEAGFGALERIQMPVNNQMLVFVRG